MKIGSEAINQDLEQHEESDCVDVLELMESVLLMQNTEYKLCKLIDVVDNLGDVKSAIEEHGITTGIELLLADELTSMCGVFDKDSIEGTLEAISDKIRAGAAKTGEVLANFLDDIAKFFQKVAYSKTEIFYRNNKVIKKLQGAKDIKWKDDKKVYVVNEAVGSFIENIDEISKAMEGFTRLTYSFKSAFGKATKDQFQKLNADIKEVLNQLENNKKQGKPDIDCSKIQAHTVFSVFSRASALLNTALKDSDAWYKNIKGIKRKNGVDVKMQLAAAKDFNRVTYKTILGALKTMHFMTTVMGNMKN